MRLSNEKIKENEPGSHCLKKEKSLDRKGKRRVGRKKKGGGKQVVFDS